MKTGSSETVPALCHAWPNILALSTLSTCLDFVCWYVHLAACRQCVIPRKLLDPQPSTGENPESAQLLLSLGHNNRPKFHTMTMLRGQLHSPFQAGPAGKRLAHSCSSKHSNPRSITAAVRGKNASTIPDKLQWLGNVANAACISAAAALILLDASAGSAEVSELLFSLQRPFCYSAGNSSWHSLIVGLQTAYCCTNSSPTSELQLPSTCVLYRKYLMAVTTAQWQK